MRGLEMRPEVRPMVIFATDMAAGGLPAEAWRPLESQKPILGVLLPVLEATLDIPQDELMKFAETRILADKTGKEETLDASSLQSLRAKNAVELLWGITVPESQMATYRSVRTITERLEAELAAGNAQIPSLDRVEGVLKDLTQE